MTRMVNRLTPVDLRMRRKERNRGTLGQAGKPLRLGGGSVLGNSIGDTPGILGM